MRRPIKACVSLRLCMCVRRPSRRLTLSRRVKVRMKGTRRGSRTERLPVCLRRPPLLNPRYAARTVGSRLPDTHYRNVRCFDSVSLRINGAACVLWLIAPKATRQQTLSGSATALSVAPYRSRSSKRTCWLNFLNSDVLSCAFSSPQSVEAALGPSTSPSTERRTTLKFQMV